MSTDPPTLEELVEARRLLKADARSGNPSKRLPALWLLPAVEERIRRARSDD